MNSMHKTALAILVGAALNSVDISGIHAKELSAPRIAPKRQVARVPPPPAKEGCYHYGSKGWKEIECTSEADLKRMRRPAYAIDSDARGFGLTTARHGPALPLVWGILDLYFDIVGSISDSGSGANAYGIQLNTNRFTGNNGDQIGVQFVYQSEPNQYEELCIWSNDLTTMDYTHHTCVPVQRDRGYGLIASDEPSIQGFVTPGHISVVGYFPWAKGGLSKPWARVAKDVYGLGQGDNWWQVSGSVMGEGDSSYLTFTDYAEVTVTLSASTCPGDVTASTKPRVACPGQPQFQPSASPSYSAVTNEDSNLVAVIGYPPTYPPLVWLNSDLAQITYIATSTGACPLATSGPPNCTPVQPPPGSCLPPGCHPPPPNISIIGSPPH